jgi:hypothetical protein
MSISFGVISIIITSLLIIIWICFKKYKGLEVAALKALTAIKKKNSTKIVAHQFTL